MEDIKNDINQELPAEKPNNTVALSTAVVNAVDNVKDKITAEALVKVDNEQSIKNHADKLAEVADKALRADIEKENIKVERINADNKAEKQEIKNRLIALNTEAKRLKREQKQILKEQRADHKRRDKNILWGTYKGKLEKMGYSYVPNIVILKMLLTIDGIVSFFEGIGKVSNAIMKAIKWLIIIVLAGIVLMVMPATRTWLLSLMGFIG